MHIQARLASTVRKEYTPSTDQAPMDIGAVATTFSITSLVTRRVSVGDRQSFYGFFTRDICDEYLTIFADFKYTRSFFDAALSAAPFVSDPFNGPNGLAFSPSGISVPIQNPFNPFKVADATLFITAFRFQ